MSDFQEKAHDLKKHFAYTGDSDAIRMINAWEERFSSLQVKKEWVTLPDTIALRNLVIEQLRNIIDVLVNKEDLSEQERMKLFAEKKCHFLYLKYLTEDPISEINMLQEKVDTQLFN